MKCICCDNLIKPYPLPNGYGLSHEDSVFKVEERKNIKIRAENRMWLNGIVSNASAGFGSSLDGDEFVIAVCDDCLSKKVEDGTIAFTSDYIQPTFSKEKFEKYKKIWRRNNNLDDLLT